MSMKRSRLEAESVGEDVLAAPVMSSVVTLFGAVRQDKRGFVNAADLARASGTTTQAYLKNEKNNLFVKTLASKLHVLPSDLVVMDGARRRRPSGSHVSSSGGHGSGPLVQPRAGGAAFRRPVPVFCRKADD